MKIFIKKPSGPYIRIDTQDRGDLIPYDGDTTKDKYTDAEVDSLFEHSPVVVPIPDPEPAPITYTLTPRQIRLALLQQGVSTTDVQNAIEAMDDHAKNVAQIEWEYAIVYKWDHPLIDQMVEHFELDKIKLFNDGDSFK